MSPEVKPKNVAYLGPAGTFCHEAVLSQKDLADKELIPLRSISDVFEAVDSSHADIGVVPLENTIEGSVALTLDMLVFDSEAMIQREIDHNISLCLAVKPGTNIEEVTTVLSHPHALAQCRGYLDQNYPDIETKSTDSTASAAHSVATSINTDGAAICPLEAANSYSLQVIDAHIQDKDINQTRFIAIGRGIPEPTGKDKTSIVCFQRANKPGSLLEILKVFAEYKIDLTKLESRPTKEQLGQYCFLIDFHGHIAQDEIAKCLEEVRTNYADVKFLGSYCVSNNNNPLSANSNNKIWKETKQWLHDLRTKVGRS